MTSGRPSVDEISRTGTARFPTRLRTSSKRAAARPLSFESTKTWIGSASRVASCTATAAPRRAPREPSKASTMGPESWEPEGTTSTDLPLLRMMPFTVEPIRPVR